MSHIANVKFWIDEGEQRTLDALGRSSARHLANNLSPDLRADAIEHRDAMVPPPPPPTMKSGRIDTMTPSISIASKVGAALERCGPVIHPGLVQRN
ncbi:hypothetical protein [Bradyrhizobium quebecense]|uniref:Uncharacterized protein n=2 Tax=Bradyrhizobium quebecense TaxID=2748629 RepID=A0ACD3V1Y3_9BRAD|nr:hypothetical protein [Bradyrhizobium quebecense]UGY00412.1 hypothetical protein J4P68_0024260 [Bradyrhizobium quebecense]